jgi:hypothetical protein
MSHEIPCLLWNQTIHHDVKEIPPLDYILIEMTPVHIITFNFLAFPGELFPAVFPTKQFCMIFSSLACPTLSILLLLFMLYIY